MSSAAELRETKPSDMASKGSKTMNHSHSDQNFGKDITSVDNALKLTRSKLILTHHIVGRNLESYEVQFAISTLIYFDVISAIIDLLMGEKYAEANGIIEETLLQGESIPLRIMFAFQNFTLFCFILEILALFYAFRFSILTHCGYCLDIVIVFVIAHNDLYNIHNFPSRLLGILRIWRVARITATSLNRVQASHDETKSNLRNAERYIDQIEMKSEQLKESCRAEIDLRTQVEKMLEAFKDEVDTLKEALRIAASDVTSAADDEFNMHREKQKKEASDTKYVDDEGDRYYDGHHEETLSSRKIIVHADGTFALD